MTRIEDFDRFLLVVGAPRCGTTTLSHFLKASPEVARPAVKEPHHFAQHDLRACSDDDLRANVENDYLRRFFGDNPQGRVGLDASVTYLYMPEQLEPVLRLWPESRFIVTLRDPLEMLPSLHRRLIYIGDETIGSFEDAWRAIPDRRAGRRIPRRCADPRWLLYDEAGRFATYLRRLFSVVGRDRCLVMLFDDLAADPAREYRRLMDFCGLEPVPWMDFGARRASFGVRSRWLQRLLKRPPKAMREFFAGEQFRDRVRDLDKSDQAASAKAVLSLRKRLLRWNRVQQPDEPLSGEMQEEICQQFKDEIDQLGDLIGRDLSHWLRPGGKAAARPVQPLGEEGRAPHKDSAPIAARH